MRRNKRYRNKIHHAPSLKSGLRNFDHCKFLEVFIDLDVFLPIYKNGCTPPPMVLSIEKHNLGSVLYSDGDTNSKCIKVLSAGIEVLHLQRESNADSLYNNGESRH